MQITFRYALLIVGLLSGQVTFSMKRLDRCQNLDEMEFLLTTYEEFLEGLPSQPSDWKHNNFGRFMPEGAGGSVILQSKKDLCPLPLAPIPSTPKQLLSDDDVCQRATICLKTIKGIKFDPKRNMFVMPFKGRIVSVDDYLNDTPDLDVRAALRHLYPADRNRINTYIDCQMQNELYSEPVDTELIEVSSESSESSDDDVDAIVSLLCNKLRNDQNFIGPKFGQSRKDCVIRYLKRSKDSALKKIWKAFNTGKNAGKFDLLLSEFINKFDNPVLEK